MNDMGYIAWMSAGMGLALMGMAASANEDDHHEQPAHEHGHGSMNVVAADHELAIELRVPGMNVVGFEHAPSSDADKREIERALSAFSQAEDLFMPSSKAKCEVEKVQVNLGGMQHGEEKHAHDASRESDLEHAHEKESDGHTELEGMYLFHCDEPSALEALEVRVFEHLRDIEELDVQVVTPTVQTALELSPDNTTVKLAR